MRGPLRETDDMGPPLFHVAADVLPAGIVLRSYALAQKHRTLIGLVARAAGDGPTAVCDLQAGSEWTALRQREDQRAEMILLEALFERTRSRLAPRLPSRLDAVFAWANLAVATRYRAEYLPCGVIHRCFLAAGTAIERDGALLVEAFETANLRHPRAIDLQLVENRAARYWLAREPMALPEVLVLGRVLIEAVVEPSEGAPSGALKGS